MSLEKAITFVVVVGVLAISTVVIVNGAGAINDALSTLGELTAGY